MEAVLLLLLAKAALRVLLGALLLLGRRARTADPCLGVQRRCATC